MKKIWGFVPALVLCLSGLFAFIPSVANAAGCPSGLTYNKWLGVAGGGDGTHWNDNLNWETTFAPGAGANIVFDNTLFGLNQSLVNDIVGLDVNSITFCGTSSHIFTITGNGISVDNGIVDDTGNGNVPKVNIDVTLTQDQTFSTDNNSVSPTNIYSGLQFGDNSISPSLNLGSHHLTISSGSIPGSTEVLLFDNLTGTGSITVNSDALAMPHFLSDNSTYSGAYTFNSSIFAIAPISDNSLLKNIGSGPININNGSSLWVESSMANSLTFVNNITIAGNGASTFNSILGITGNMGALNSCNLDANIKCGSGSIIFSGLVTLTGNSTASSNFGSGNPIEAVRTVTYTLTGRYVTNCFTLTAVPGFNVSIVNNAVTTNNCPPAAPNTGFGRQLTKPGPTLAIYIISALAIPTLAIVSRSLRKQ